MTLCPIWLKATAKLMEVVVLPTPPLPLAMPMTSVLRDLLMAQTCGFGLESGGDLRQLGSCQVVQRGIACGAGHVIG